MQEQQPHPFLELLLHREATKLRQIIESLDTATFDGMPQAANATGIVDHVLPPREIAKTLTTLASLDPAQVM